MKQKRELLTPAQRIAWAIAHSGKTLVQIAEEIGCSHAALSQWATGKTVAEHIKAGLLQRFADAVAVEIRWLLTGDGPARTHYPAHHQSFIAVAREIDEMEGPLPSQAERLLRALLPDNSSH
jgi:transcriptional regulator with XRE-family HTH domain